MSEEMESQLIGLPNKEVHTRKVVIRILCRVILWSVEKIWGVVVTVHRLGKRNGAAPNMLTQTSDEFAKQTVQDEIWKKLRKNLNFKFGMTDPNVLCSLNQIESR